MRTINLFPNEPVGDYRKALGYQWAEYVPVRNFWTEAERAANPWGGIEAHESSMPGEDIVMSVADCKAMLKEQYGELAYRDNSTYGWLKETAVTEEGKTISVANLVPVANINGMWCGGLNETVYAVNSESKEVTPKQSNESAGEEAEETAAIESMTERIELAELDHEHMGQFGWCNKCHSYCYGDCETSK